MLLPRRQDFRSGYVLWAPIVLVARLDFLTFEGKSYIIVYYCGRGYDVFWLATPHARRQCEELLKPLISEAWNSPGFQSAWRTLKREIDEMPTADIEPFADAMTRELFISDNLSDNLALLLLDPILSALKRFIESNDGVRMAAVLAKYTAMRGVSSQFTAETMYSLASKAEQSLSDELAAQIDSDPTAHEREAQQQFEKAINFLSGQLLQARFGDLKTNVTPRVVEGLIPDFISIATEAAEFNPYFGAAICVWVRKVIQTLGERSHDDQVRAVADAEIKCIESSLAFEKHNKLIWLEFKSLSDLAFRELFELRHIERASDLAARAVKLGSHLWERTTRDSKKAELTDRIAPLCRFSADPDLVATWLERARSPLQLQAKHCEVVGNLPQAAHLYSQIAFRSFVGAEFARTERLYNLATFFFDKADFCRRHIDPVDSLAASGNEYRLFEARGFSAASSARRNQDIASATEQFGDAAQHLHRASRLAWESGPEANFGSHIFYESAAHFFLAIAQVYRAARAESQQSFVFHCLRSSEIFPKCFSMFRNVFKAYGAILEYAVSFEPSGSEPIRVNLIANLYPRPDLLLLTATAIKNAIVCGDDPRPHALELAKSFLFIDPRG